MAEPMGRRDPWSLLRRATVRLVDPADPARWGTGFFVARDVLLTCWHVVRDGMAKREGTAPRLLVEWPGEDQGPQGSLPVWSLGEATLLEAGTPWDLALLRVTPSREGAAAGQAGGIDPGALAMVPLLLQDPPPPES